MLNDLIEKRKKTLAESEQHKNKRNELNAQASKFAGERNALNGQTRGFVEEAQQNKEARDKYNTEVQALKEQRNELNRQANELFEEIEVYKKEHGNIRSRGLKEPPEAGRVPGIPAADRGLHHRQGTGADREDQADEGVHQGAGGRARAEQGIRTKLTEAREFRKQASELHAKVTEMADLAQKHHDSMVECYKKADKSRESADEVHRQFVEAQEAADAEHKAFIGCQKELRDFDKVISGLRKKTAKAKVTKEQKAVRQEAERIFNLFRGGEKLTTDDILLLQRSKLI